VDPAVIDALAKAGIDPALQDSFATIGIVTGPPDRIHPIEGGSATVVSGTRTAEVQLRTIPELWSGNARPPDFSHGPTKDYVMFFAVLEATAADYCASTGRRVRDREFERLYDHLRRRPDGEDSNPLFSYLQASAALYLSLRGGSREEFEAVVRRLARSARTFSDGWTSTWYLDRALLPLLEPEA
jgi:hypothetical protein